MQYALHYSVTFLLTSFSVVPHFVAVTVVPFANGTEMGTTTLTWGKYPKSATTCSLTPWKLILPAYFRYFFSSPYYSYGPLKYFCFIAVPQKSFPRFLIAYYHTSSHIRYPHLYKSVAGFSSFLFPDLPLPGKMPLPVPAITYLRRTCVRSRIICLCAVTFSRYRRAVTVIFVWQSFIHDIR